MIDGLHSGGSATRGRLQDQRARQGIKRRKQARDKVEDLRFELELKKARGL